MDTLGAVVISWYLILTSGSRVTIVPVSYPTLEMCKIAGRDQYNYNNGK